MLELPMIENIPFNDDNIAGFRIDGRLTAEAYDGIRDVVDAKLARHQKLRIYVEIANDTRISAEAFFKDLKFALRPWDRFELEAVEIGRASCRERVCKYG